MNRGGYDQTGQQGGFRANIRDAEKQKHLEEADRVVKTEETVDRLIASAEADLATRPGDLPTIDKLGKLLMERGRPADEERPLAVHEGMGRGQAVPLPRTGGGHRHPPQAAHGLGTPEDGRAGPGR